jgi:hypothetical protein
MTKSLKGFKKFQDPNGEGFPVWKVQKLWLILGFWHLLNEILEGNLPIVGMLKK